MIARRESALAAPEAWGAPNTETYTMRTQRLSASQLRELRSEMEHELAWLLRSLTGQRSNSAHVANGDSNTEASEQDTMERLLRNRAQSRLAAIIAALSRLDAGAYGECVSCRRPISYARLAVVPEATVCIACGGHGAALQHRGAALGNAQPGGIVTGV